MQSTLLSVCLLCHLSLATSFLIPSFDHRRHVTARIDDTPFLSKQKFLSKQTDALFLRTIHQMGKEDTGSVSSKIITSQDELDEYAKSVGVKLTFSTLGPGYRAVARAYHDPEQILGYCEGFVRPGGKILHVDKLEVWKKALSRAKADNPEGFKNGGQVFGVSLLLGYTCMLHGTEKKCAVAEFLAIDDEDFQHKRLVRFFKRAGFQVVRYVGDDITDVPDRLVWGGCGTLMNQKIDTLLERWSNVLKI